MKLQSLPKFSFEESNILSHLAQSYNASLTDEERRSNLDKAKNHLERITLDLHKLVWVSLRTRLSQILEHRTNILCFNIPEHEVLEKYAHFTEGARAARRLEMQNVGVETARAAQAYDDTNKIGFELLESFDGNKSALVQTVRFVFKSKEFCLGIAGGVVASLIAACIWAFFSAASH